MLTGLIIGLICLGIGCGILVLAACICSGRADEKLGYK